MIDPETIIDGRYRVISRMGSGGMAEVYLAEDRLLGRQVAVKILHHRFAEDQEFVERFRREAQSAAGLSHPNVVSIFDRGEWNGTYYIAMEYLPGRSLKQVVREHGALEPLSAINIVIQILHAARFAHRRGIIHRDLKPHNVILDEEGRAKVTDFGIARAGASDMTLTGSIMGTAQYLSPEQAQGHPVSASSDLYAVGIVLYELLTGQIPFDGETAVSIALQQVSAVPPPPSALNPSIPPPLDAVVLHALAKDPAKRFTNADEFISALQTVRDGLSQGSTSIMASSAPTNDRSSASGGALLLAAEPPQSQDTKKTTLLWIAATLAVAAIAAAAIFVLADRARQVTVPKLAGEPQALAASKLQADGLKATFSGATSRAVPPGSVINTSPTAGRKISRGSQVTLVISSGPGDAPVPEVAGLSRSEAERTLRAHGFRPAIKHRASSTVKAGFVISTEPAAETDARVGSSVNILLSNGPAKVGVPDLTGDTQEQAAGALASAGLKVGAVTQQTSTQTAGTVLSQSPQGGASVASGTPVDFVLAQAPATVHVPGVVGKKEERAVGEIAGAGFKSNTVTAEVTDPTRVGIVIAQSPKAGKNVKRNSTVTITVGVAPATTTTETTSSTTTSTAAANPVPPPAGGQ
ncbi:MAG TPA: Stk1 family PASTA domain-containing Ser/Thr kinase [Solirubrobacteraceae bacterium]|jgi:serine/threonine-protein kinase